MADNIKEEILKHIQDVIEQLSFVINQAMANNNPNAAMILGKYLTERTEEMNEMKDANSEEFKLLARKYLDIQFKIAQDVEKQIKENPEVSMLFSNAVKAKPEMQSALREETQRIKELKSKLEL